jgi:hypothetical protein
LLIFIIDKDETKYVAWKAEESDVFKTEEFSSVIGYARDNHTPPNPSATAIRYLVEKKLQKWGV